MNNLNLLKERPKNSVTRLTKNSKIFKTIISAIQDKKGENIISLDLRKIPEAVADFFIIPFFVIATAWNTGQIVFTSLLLLFALVSILDPIYFRW